MRQGESVDVGKRRRGIGLLAAASCCLSLALALGACSNSSPAAPTESSYAGAWTFTVQLTAIDSSCGHTAADIGVQDGPIPVKVASTGTFSVPSPVNATGAIDSAGNVKLTLAARSNACTAGEGAGGCVNTSHCDGTAVQAGDVTKWVLRRR